ncbi:MAG: hypothetical protein KGR98_05375 [Verrucomicrobia bacterium]|nr:hypothetical protein [Verrucomicrobiota bacterium]MDE3098870.1 hypothetical protein [Verrucomicrobiota bacterium]
MPDTTIEIPPARWNEFCRAVNDAYRGAVTIRVVQQDGIERDLAHDVPLRLVAFQKQGECNDAVTIEAGPFDERPLQHQIIEPIRIMLKKNGESGRYKHVEILAETGMTEVTFTPGINSTVLEKLAA